ncbi:TPA: EpsG family protein [Proteus mirabilis]|uniref:EpsG family protein n=2 Tax=Proteus mirabilis TaxID=584 RepID=UPI0023F99C66|nr:EpsG family protein [Proteus mirabilis]
MIYYSIFIFSSTILLFLSRLVKGTNFLFYTAVFMAILFSGFRYDAGNDYPTYYAMATGYVNYDRLELIPKLIMDVSFFSESPAIFFFVTSFIYIICVQYFCCKLSENKELSFLLFLLFPLSFLTSFGYVRQFLSIGFFICAIAMRVENKNKTSLFFVLLSIACHMSAVFFIPIILFKKVLSKRKIPLIISVVVIVLSILFSSLVVRYSYLAGRYEHYINGANVIDAGKKIGYISIALLAYLYIFGRKIRTSSEIYLFNIYVVFCVMYAFLMNFGEYVVRVSYFLFPVFWVLIPKTIILKGSIFKYIQILLIASFGFLMFFTTLYLASTNPTRDFLTDYSIIFLK